MTNFCIEFCNEEKTKLWCSLLFYHWSEWPWVTLPELKGGRARCNRSLCNLIREVTLNTFSEFYPLKVSHKIQPPLKDKKSHKGRKPQGGVARWNLTGWPHHGSELGRRLSHKTYCLLPRRCLCIVELMVQQPEWKEFHLVRTTLLI